LKRFAVWGESDLSGFALMKAKSQIILRFSGTYEEPEF
jgi:hypothetical protein